MQVTLRQPMQQAGWWLGSLELWKVTSTVYFTQTPSGPKPFVPAGTHFCATDATLNSTLSAISAFPKSPHCHFVLASCLNCFVSVYECVYPLTR